MKKFLNGSSWLLTDFHLHTRSDKHFTYGADANYFVSNFVNKLKENKISVAAITNHDRFNLQEFKEIRNLAAKTDIYILAGVELSVQEGNGIHMLVIFSDEWFRNNENTDYINRMLGALLPIENNSNNIEGTLNIINNYKKDYFVIFAHVEDEKGLFKMCKTQMQGWRKTPFETKIRNVMLAFQKVRTNTTRTDIQNKLGDLYPAEIEASDNKSIDEIGKNEHKTYIKLSAFTFEALKYAFIDKEYRLSSEDIASKHSYIEEVSFEGGHLAGKTIHFSSELNTLIGIRGSGKSGILELINYTLGIDTTPNIEDIDYKRKLIPFILGSGGKIKIKVKGKDNKTYFITKIYGNSTQIYDENKQLLESGIKINDTILGNPQYFGQKDLSNRGKNFANMLVDKIIGNKLEDVRVQINKKNTEVLSVLQKLRKISKDETEIDITTAKINDIKQRLKIFQDLQILEKLQEKADYQIDLEVMKDFLNKSESILDMIKEPISDFEKNLTTMLNYKNKQNNIFWTKFKQQLSEFQSIYNTLSDNASLLSKMFFDTVKPNQNALGEIIKGLEERFASIERTISEDMTKKGLPSIDINAFSKLQGDLKNSELLLTNLQESNNNSKSIKDSLNHKLTELQDLWHREFMIACGALGTINAESESLKITVDFQANVEEFSRYLKDILKGSNIRGEKIESFCNSGKYPNMIELYRNIDIVTRDFFSSSTDFKSKIEENLEKILIFQTPNKYLINYNGKELSNHSLGQRASALLIFSLNQKESDIVIIDQPEDDIDNQTIYDDVIKLILKIKPNKQFIFATHNPNIPVLADADLVCSCRYSEINKKIDITLGGIDNYIIQKNIVNIMEGGKEAFRKRKEIYGIWNMQNL